MAETLSRQLLLFTFFVLVAGCILEEYICMRHEFIPILEKLKILSENMVIW